LQAGNGSAGAGLDSGSSDLLSRDDTLDRRRNLGRMQIEPH
jgi:hypothetical protein